MVRRWHLGPIASWVFAAVVAGGCARPDERSDDSASSGSSTSSTSAAAESTSEGGASSEDIVSPGVDWDCDPVVPGEYLYCPEGNSAVCGPVGTCMEAFAVEGGRVCVVTGCTDRCDCFAPPDSGTATVECLEGVIANDTACVLRCGNGESCPDGMVCSVQACVWPPP